MGKGKTGQVKAGFARLLEEAICTTTIPGFSYAFLERDHPLGFGYPERVDTSGCGIIFIGDSHTICSRGLLRLTSWAMANDLEGNEHHAPEFLRVTTIGNPDETDSKLYGCGCFYEVLVYNAIFMTGSWESWKTEIPARKELDQAFRFLSHTYGLPVYKNHLTYEQLGAKEISDTDFEDTLIYAAEENKKRILEYRANQRTYRLFQKGEIVTWNPDVPPWDREEIEGPVGQESYEVKDVEFIPDYCNCGLGEDTFAEMHAKHRCNLHRRFWNNHHQILTVSVKGIDTKLTGAYFDPSVKFAY